MIVETNDEQTAQEAQDAIHLARVSKYQALGYTILYANNVPGVPNGTPGIVPKDGNGNDVPAATTYLWDIPSSSPDDTYYIADATDVAPTLPGINQTDYVVRDMPDEWISGYPSDEFNSQFNSNEFEV